MRSMSAKMDQPRPLSSSGHPWMHRGRQGPAPGTRTQQLTPVLTLQARWAETFVLHIKAIRSCMAERFKNSSIAVVFPGQNTTVTASLLLGSLYVHRHPSSCNHLYQVYSNEGMGFPLAIR